MNRVRFRRKYIGFFLSVLGITMMLLGLVAYLNGPFKSGTTLWKRAEEDTLVIEPGKFATYRCTPIAPGVVQSLISEVQTNASIAIRGEKRVRAYLLNEDQYSRLKNNSGFSTEIESFAVDLPSINWRSLPNSTYYIILSNLSNETLIAKIQVSRVYTIQFFNYEYAFIGLKFALIGGLLFALSFPLYNPLDKLLHRVQTLQVFPGIDEYLSKREGTTLHIWALVVGALLITIYDTCHSLVEVSKALSDLPQLFIPLVQLFIPLVQDVIIRFGLFEFFATLLPIMSIIVAHFLTHNIFRNFLYWWFGARHGHIYDKELSERCNSLFWRRMSSLSSFILYFVIGFSALIVYQFAGENPLLPILTALVPFVLLVTYNLSLSYRDGCQTLSQFEQMKFFIHANILAVMLFALLSLLIWFWSWDLFLSIIYAKIFLSSTLFVMIPTLREWFSEKITYALSALSSIKGNLILTVVGLIVVLAQAPSLLYAIHPSVSKKHGIEISSKVKIFLLTFTFVQLILAICQQNLMTATLASITVSLATTILKACITESWKTVIMKPRFCPKCGRDLSYLPKDTLFCPYCGELIKVRNS
jgi:hypothetical protein